MSPTDRLSQLRNDYLLAKRQRKQEREALSRLELRYGDLEECQKILQGIASDVQQRSHDAIARLVTRCLKTVFGDDGYELRIQFQQRRGKTEADLTFYRDGKEVDPVTSAGGGAVDVSSFALRLACLLLSRPPRRRLLVLDEGFKHLSSEYQPVVRELIETLAKELGVQIVMVTHSEHLRCGKVVEL